MTVTVYHNPRCSKSRETVKILQERGIEFITRLYLQDIPSETEIKNLLKSLNFSSASTLMRRKENLYKDLQLADETNEDALIAAMVAHPQLIERPIVVVDGDGDGEHHRRAKIGRPPSSVLALFEKR